MKKNIRKSIYFYAKRFSLITFVFLGIVSFLPAQTPSFEEKIRIPLWSEIDAYPADFSDNFSDENPFDYPVSKLKETAPFLINGMVYGWDFVYVPYDKTRQVEEYFELSDIVPQEVVSYKIKYSSPWIEDNQLNCWVEYFRSEAEKNNYKMWASIQNQVIKGRGYGPLEEGFDGIKKATEEAVKNAVREHFRPILKNKPKEIRGSVLIRSQPILNVSSGRYVIILDFFLEYSKIKMYTQF